MTNEKNNSNIFGALVLGLGVLFSTGWAKIDTLFDINILISFVVFSLLSYVSIRAYREFKYLGIIMFGSIFLLSPEVFSTRKGELFPITYITFMVYFSIVFGKFLYKKWKISL